MWFYSKTGLPQGAEFTFATAPLINICLTPLFSKEHTTAINSNDHFLCVFSLNAHKSAKALLSMMESHSSIPLP